MCLEVSVHHVMIEWALMCGWFGSRVELYQHGGSSGGGWGAVLLRAAVESHCEVRARWSCGSLIYCRNVA